MNARQWLGRARYIDREIQSLEKALQDARDQATRITQNYAADGAQSTKDPHKLDSLAEYADLIRQKQEELFEAKKEITAAIYQLWDGRLRTILVDYYINILTLEQIAVKESYSYAHVKRLRLRGIEAIEKKMSLNEPLQL